MTKLDWRKAKEFIDYRPSDHIYIKKKRATRKCSKCGSYFFLNNKKHKLCLNCYQPPKTKKYKRNQRKRTFAFKNGKRWVKVR